jgi:hypothetical protein
MVRWSVNIDEVVRLALEKSSADKLQSYLLRGRCFKNLGDADLSQKYVEAMRTWALDPSDTSRSFPVSDVVAEYELRGSSVPRDLAAAEWEMLTSAAERAAEAMSDKRKEEIGLGLFIEWANAKKEQH